MGLNIGIYVNYFPKQYAWEDKTKPLDKEELEKEFFCFLRERFPASEEFGEMFGGGWVDLEVVTFEDGEQYYRYDFDVRMYRYGMFFYNAGYSMDEMYSAISEFIMKQFSLALVHDDFVMEPYHNG